jgi:hypothetical protein
VTDTTTPRCHDIVSEAELLGPVGGTSLHLRFDGPFEGRTVTWDATFTTLAACSGAPAPLRNFIDIGDESGRGLTLTVGLNVPRIDLPTVRKTMMMIRQYKRLSRGRHEYGQPAPQQETR